MKIDEPLRIVENRIWRLYTGGALLDHFKGKKGKDGHFPEEWIASTTKANNPGREDILGEGLARVVVGQQELMLIDLLKDNETAFPLLGCLPSTPSTGVLVKFLDSAIRLPLQSHPDRLFAKEHLGVNHGKTESWIVLDTRNGGGEESFVYFGFKKGVQREAFEKAVREQRNDVITASLNRVPVKRGDVIYVPANVVHAIGAGIFMVEIQEPTDLIFRFDRKGPFWNLSEEEVHMGLGLETMLNTLDYRRTGSDLLGKYLFHKDFDAPENRKEALFPKEMTECFSADVITVSKGEFHRQGSRFSILIVIAGEGRLVCPKNSVPLKQGAAFLVPYAVGESFYVIGKDSERLTVIEVYPPDAYSGQAL